MSGSFSKIDYSIRPAKYAERRMLRDIFRRTSAFQPAEQYTYVGFGSVWFSDFILFHRSLGIQKMVSIESARSAEKRVRDNVPFRIDLHFDRAAKVLPTLCWDERQFVWLDYDDAMSPETLRDVRTAAGRLRSGSLLAVSFRCSAAREVDQADSDDTTSAMDRFRERFSSSQIPADVSEEDLTGWPFASVTRRMIESEVEAALKVRNSVSKQDVVHAHTICAFNYQDGAMMTTWVGIVYADSEADKFAACAFDNLDFMRDDGEPIHISVPKLTAGEFKRLEAQLPLKVGPLALGSIPQKEADAFWKFYRYFPSFVVTES